MGMTIAVIAILSIMVFSKLPETVADSEEPSNSLTCDRICHETYATNLDENGRSCRGPVQICKCQGRCLSYTTSHWEFPYRKYWHQVCLPGQRVKKVTILPNCDAGVVLGTERYEHLELGACQCSVCDSSDTSCEGARKRRKPPSAPAVEERNSLMDVLLSSVKPQRMKRPYFTSQILQPPPLYN